MRRRRNMHHQHYFFQPLLTCGNILASNSNLIVAYNISKFITLYFKPFITAWKVSVFGFSGPYLPAFGLNTDQKNSKYGHFSRSLCGSKNCMVFPMFVAIIMLYCCEFCDKGSGFRTMSHT